MVVTLSAAPGRSSRSCATSAAARRPCWISPLLGRHRPWCHHRPGGNVDRRGRRHVRADPALPIRLPVEPGAGGPGERTVMTICAVALVDAMPSNRTSIGAALDDTAQEVGTSIGTAVIGTLIAVLVTTQLPAGTWSNDLVASFFHGERITYAVLALVVGVVAAAGALTLTDSHATEEPVPA